MEPFNGHSRNALARRPQVRNESWPRPRSLHGRRTTTIRAPTSNAQTKAVRSLQDHPLKRFQEQGIKVTISTDSRTVSDITLGREFQNAVRMIGCTPAQVWAMNLQALEGGFGENSARLRLRREFIEAEAALRTAPARG